MQEGFLTELDFEKKLKVLMAGFPGSGKSYSALLLAKYLKFPMDEIVIINTEKRRGLLYRKEFGLKTSQFYNILAPYTPEKYINAIDTCVTAGYKLIIIDSLSHEWTGKGGAMMIVGNMTGKDGMKNWTEYKTTRHATLIEKIMETDVHIIATARSNFDYEEQEDSKGKKRRVKVGTGIVQDKHTEFEFDFTFEFNPDHTFKVTKTSTGGIHIFDPGYDYTIDEHTAKLIQEWLDDQNSELDQSKLQNEQQKTQEKTEKDIEENQSVESVESRNGQPIFAKTTIQSHTSQGDEQSSSEPDLEKEVNDILDLIEAMDDIDSIPIIQKQFDLFRNNLPEETVKFLEDNLLEKQKVIENF